MRIKWSRPLQAVLKNWGFNDMHLPLTNNPEESFSISIFDIIYNMRQLWNEHGFWTLDIHDADGSELVLGIKIIAGENITMQYPQVPFSLINYEDVDPGRNDLEFFLLEVTERDD